MAASNISLEEQKVGSEAVTTGFPKLKTPSTASLAQEHPRSTPAVASKAQTVFWWSVGMLIAQAILFLLTVLLLSQAPKNMAHVPLGSEMPSTETQRSFEVIGANREARNNSSLEEAQQERADEVLVLADFNQERLTTNLNSPIFVEGDGFSSSVLSVHLDEHQPFGKTGKSLRIDYRLNGHGKKQSRIAFRFPEILLSSYHELSFRLKGTVSAGDSPKIGIELLDKTGEKVISRPVAVWQSFWKKHSLPLNSEETKGFRLERIHFLIHGNSDVQSGSIYLDNIELVS